MGLFAFEHEVQIVDTCHTLHLCFELLPVFPFTGVRNIKRTQYFSFQAIDTEFNLSAKITARGTCRKKRSTFGTKIYFPYLDIISVMDMGERLNWMDSMAQDIKVGIVRKQRIKYGQRKLSKKQLNMDVEIFIWKT